MSVQDFCPFFDMLFLLLSCRNFKKYIQYINLLWAILFIHIFSHVIGCLFTLLIVSWCTKVFNFAIVQYIFLFSFVACAFGVISKNHCQIQCQEISPCFLLSFIVLALKVFHPFWVHFCLRCKVRVRLFFFLAFGYPSFPSTRDL